MGDSAASFLDNTRTAIRMTINGQEVQLRIGDCIKFEKYDDDDNMIKVTGKISEFYHSAGEPNRIVYSVWDNNKWFGRGLIGLVGAHVGINGILWNSIDKIKCPDSVNHGGKRRKHRATKKKARRAARRRHSRKH